ncbi:uncharacterized protein PITG_09066 [Phytophthora infestans T30-4]|uniref:Uncharacterized protein n=1 Tax=Phytophthora infestans (strain T30-4) TaxID=403677 RepID=D0NBM0_PHYIT|nr:uncharacterized protein PITG_09066 [Phytophthora infestans T30-4]EEY55175.1 conserved hypothetical protein [Phytophthora infestans T30-4]|eukprot:XP_002903399.1 conserved hypothetical protein [Phytophthora infestans T30-4]
MSRRLHSDDSGIFDMLESKVGARFFELDVIVSVAHQPVLDGAYEHVQVCRDDGRDAAAAVEFRYVRLLPFGHDATAKTLWEIIELGGLITDQHFHVAKRSNDVIGMASRFTIPLDRGNSNTVNVDVHSVAKRFTGPLGMVVLVESRSEWTMSHPTASGWKQVTEEADVVIPSFREILSSHHQSIENFLLDSSIKG